MKSVQLKKPYGRATFARVRSARYLGWEDAFEVEFAGRDGRAYALLPIPAQRLMVLREVPELVAA